MSSAGQLFPSQYKKKILVGHEGSLNNSDDERQAPFGRPGMCVPAYGPGGQKVHLFLLFSRLGRDGCFNFTNEVHLIALCNA